MAMRVSREEFLGVPTQEERREVARNLRTVNLAEGAAQVEETEGLDMAAAGRFVAIPNLGSTIGGMDPIFSFYDLQNRLADLIEPLPERTCLNIEKDEQGYWHDFLCSECGEAYDESDDMSYSAERINYCPNCGAKVVQDAD